MKITYLKNNRIKRIELIIEKTHRSMFFNYSKDYADEAELHKFFNCFMTKKIQRDDERYIKLRDDSQNAEIEELLKKIFGIKILTYKFKINKSLHGERRKDERRL